MTAGDKDEEKVLETETESEERGKPFVRQGKKEGPETVREESTVCR